MAPKREQPHKSSLLVHNIDPLLVDSQGIGNHFSGLKGLDAMKMFLAESWQDRSEIIEVLNPFDGKIVDTVPMASLSDVEAALAAASKGTLPIRRLSGFDRSKILKRAAD